MSLLPTNRGQGASVFIVLLCLLIGGLLGAAGVWLYAPSEADAVDEEKPLYWVAPMDPNYRRDEPGLSPMGMELVPVYEEAPSDNTPGEITISPEVVNNLGVRTAKVERQALVQPIQAFGELQFDEDRLVHIHPRLSGWVEKLYVKAAGDRVEENAPLYALYSPELVSAQEELLLAMGRDNTRLVNAAIERLKALQIPNDFIQRLRKTQTIQQTVTFYTPQTGVVDKLNIREGYFVQPGTTMLSIASLATVWVESDIFANQAPLIQQGMPVTMTLDFIPGQRWQGIVDYVYPSLNRERRTLRVRSRFDNDQHQLKPGMYAKLTLHSAPAESVLAVPSDALIRLEQQTRAVVALGEGRYKSVAVETGQHGGDFVEVKSGLLEGDTVVVSAQFLLDSESSKTSDFLRMAPIVNDYPSAEVTGLINSIDLVSRVMNISRGAIEQWGRGPATMDFTLAKDLVADGFVAGQNIIFTFEIRDGDFVIVAISPAQVDMANEHAHDHQEGGQ